MRMMRKDLSTSQGGSSLLEVLIAIVIMSFGLLAMAGLTAASQQYVKLAQFQSIGMQLASELSERMRGNVSGYELGSYQKKDAYATSAVAAPSCAASPCTAAEIASQDIANWTQAVRTRLPGGDAFVQRDAVNALATDIWIVWVDPDLRESQAQGTSLSRAADCPAGAIASLSAGKTVRCMYYRVSL